MNTSDDGLELENESDHLYQSFEDRSSKTRKRISHKKAKPSHSFSSTGSYATTGKNWLRANFPHDPHDSLKKNSRRSKTISSIPREDLFAVADKPRSKPHSSKHHTIQRASARNSKREQFIPFDFPDHDSLALNRPAPNRTAPTHSDSTDQLGSSSSAATLLNSESSYLATNAHQSYTIPSAQHNQEPEAAREEDRCPNDRLEFINNLAPLLKLNLPSRLDKCRSDREYHRRSRHRSGEEVLSSLPSTDKEEMIRESLWMELQHRVRGWRRDNIIRERNRNERVVKTIREFSISKNGYSINSNEQQNTGICLEEVIKEASTFSNITEALKITPQYLVLLQITMELVDKLLLRVNRFQSVFRNSHMLKAMCPAFFESDVENRVKTVYQWRSIVHQLNSCVAQVCSELNVDCCMIVAQLYKELGSDGSERDNKAFNRLSVIYSPYELDLETSLDSSSDDNASPDMIKMVANKEPLSTVEGGGAMSPVDSTLNLFSGGPRAPSPYPFDGQRHPSRPPGMDSGVCVVSSAGSSGKHQHLSQYQQNQSSCSFDHELDISDKDDRRKICRRYAETSMVKGGVRKIMENLFHLIDRIIVKSKYTLLRPVKPAACSSLSSHQSMCFAEAIRNNQSISGDTLGFIPIRNRKFSDASYEEEEELHKMPTFQFEDTHDSNRTPRINFRNWHSRNTEEHDMDHFQEAGHTGSLGWGTIPESEEEDAAIEERDDYKFGVWSKEFEDMNLPSFLPHFAFLVRVPLDTVHECILMHLEQEVDILNNTRCTDIPLLKHVINEYKEALRCGVIVRRYYQKTLGPCLPLRASLCPGSEQRFMDEELEEFEADLNRMLQQYLICVRDIVTKMQDYQEASTLKSRVEDEWEFVKHVGSLIRDGKAEAAKQFCDLATVQLNAISDNLEPNILEITSQLFDKAAQDDDEDDKENDAASAPSTGYKFSHTGSSALGSPPDSCKFSPGTSISSSGKEKRRAIYNAFKDIQKKFTDARISLLKAIDYAKMLSSDLEIAADLAFLTGCSSHDLLVQLAKTQHVLIVMEASHDVIPSRHGFSRDEMLGTFEFDEDLTHLSSQSTSCNYGVFVPHEIVSDLHAIEDLLYAVFSPRDKTDDAEFKANYLLLVENCKDWRGKRVNIQPSVEHTVVMSHTEVKGVMLMARSGVQLAPQLKYFMTQFANILRVECNQMACHQSIVGSMNELKECARRLGNTLQSCLKEVKLSLDQYSNKQQKISDKLVNCLENCFSVAFAYHRELYRIAKTPETRRQMMPTLMDLFDLWDQVVRKYHERGKGKMPRWANDGCDFLLYMLTQPLGIAVITEERWTIFKKSVDELVVYIVGEPHNSSSNSTAGGGCNVSSGHSSRLLITSSNSPATVMEEEELGNNESYNDNSNSVPISGAQSLAMCSRSISVHDKPLLHVPPPLDNFGPPEHPHLSTWFSVPGVGSQQEADVNRIHSKSDASFKGFELTSEMFQDKNYSRRSSMLKKLNELDEKRTKKLQETRKIGTVREKQIDLKRPPTRDVPFKWHRGQLIGTGRAKVYSAIRYDTRERIAIKQVTELEKGDRKKINDVVQETIKEYDLIAQLDHINLLKYYGIEVSKTELILFMEYCDGGTLAALAQELLEEPFIRYITRSVLNAVNYLHTKGIVHRDIKSANIFVCSESCKEAIVKLGDFGTATQLYNPNEGTMEKEITDIIGTLIYTAPEVCRGEYRGYGRACDIWSLACVVLEMITGKPPWVELAGEHQLSVMFKLGQGYHPQVPPVGGRMSEHSHAFIIQCFCESANRPTANQLLEQSFVQC